MEPDIIPLHSSSLPLMDDDGDGEVASEEDEFKDFSVGMPCSSLNFADATESPSSFRPPSPTSEPATHQPSCSSKCAGEQSQPTSKVKLESGKAQTDVGQQDSNAEPYLHLTNGFAESEHNSGAHTSSVAGGRSPVEEMGFADFTVFTKQMGHPWCCGFSPMANAEQKDARVRGTNSSFSEQMHESGEDCIMESEPRSHCAHKEKQNICTEIRDSEKRDKALVQPSQVHHQPQEAAGNLNFPSEEKELDKPWDSQRERRNSFNSPQTSEVQDDGDAEEIFQTCSMYEPMSEDLASFSDDLSFEVASADLEPNVSSLASQDDQTDWDQFDEEDEDLGNCRRSDSFGNSNVTNLNQIESERGVHHCEYPTQENSATSKQSQSGTNLQDRFADFTDSSFEHHRPQEDLQKADAGVQILGNLPLSDSFADFCSAPTQEDEEVSWAEFSDQSAEDGKSWRQFRVPVSSQQTDVDDEEKNKQDRVEGTRRNSSQEILQASFPKVVVPAVEDEKELIGLSALLQAEHLSEGGEEVPVTSSAQWIQQEMLRPHQDVHSAVGLQFQWGGSHTNRTLLSCLGVDTRNVVFTGRNKQFVTVPAFASSLGMLEPTKDAVPAACSSERTAVTAQAPPGPRDIPGPSTHSAQEELPSSQLDWSGRGLSSSQDDCCALNLDYFGPEDDSRSSSFTQSQNPTPGIDPELYELTISKLEINTNSSHPEDTLNRLMSSAEKTSISVRKFLPSEELSEELRSEEASRVIAVLPNLSFMKAKVLMFPSILLPKARCSPK
ncbi:aftiphilin isoform X2 [Oreochromis niloticus]|uniref:aftiphilin isoform X2 n=1 Tax=Oreochromis niloticus TaxID=8128 RepID=UPI000393FC1D|nr:aftiphilin isoform X2 [Oreochromis niloticus]